MKKAEAGAFFLSKREIVVLCLSGLFAGVINGALGSGGGVLLVLTSSLMFSERDNALKRLVAPKDTERKISPAPSVTSVTNVTNVPSDPKSCFATAVASVLPMSLVSVVFYAVFGGIDVLSYIEFPICAVFGGVLGALLTDKTPPSVLKTVFAALTVWAGIRML